MMGAAVAAPEAFAGDDPFAQMDSIAGKIKSSSNYPNSISPLPTYKQTEQELTSDKKPVDGKAGAATATTFSDMEDALKNSKKRRNIDPLTHG
jgi:hypothetical protein